MLTRPGVLLRIEGAALFTCSLFFYHSMAGNWWLFLALFLSPDLFMLGYLANVKLGATLYNLAHADAIPLILLAVAYSLHQPVVLTIALIWLAHIGWDRALGYGLKYPTFFKDTHLQRVNAKS